jgi:hypothetical protein
MAIQYVGGATATKVGATSGNSTISLTSLTGGIASSAAIGDLVIAVFATGSAADRTLSITDGTTAYTLIGTELYSNGTTYDTNLEVSYKLLTANDTSVTFGPTGNAQDAGAMAVHVWRGVDSTTVLDVAAVSATGTGTGRPNPASITPTTSGAYIVIAGAGAAGTGAVFTASYLSNFRTATSADTNDAMVGIGSLAWTSGPYDGAQWTGGTTNAADSWAAMTIALRPQLAVDHETTGTLTGQLGSVVGSAQSNALHTTTGVLAGQGSVITGDADREAAIIPHTTTGALTGQGSIVTGSADTAQIRTSSGALVGQGSLLAGDADHEVLVIPHVATGVLVGDASDINGTANRTRQHLTSGVLAGQTATITGDADREGAVVDHETTGDLVGSGSVITGEATRTEKVTHETSGTLVGSGSIVTGKAKNESASTEVTGASVTRRQRQPSLVIVEVDGKEYRVQQSQLNAFLNQVKQEAKADAQQPVKKAKKKRKNVIVEEPKQEIQIVVKSIPVNIIPEISAKIQKTNLLISQYYAKAMERHLSDMDDEEVLLMLI